MRWPNGIRTRLAVAFVALVAVTAVVLGVGASVVADVRLHAQALEDAAAEARFDLSVTIPARQLPAQPTADDIDRSGLAETFRIRDIESIVALPDSPPFLSIDAMAGLLDRVPADVRQRVAAGEVAYTWAETDGGEPVLVIGGRPSGSASGGPEFYFVHDVSGLQAAVDQLRLALAVGALVLILIALAASRAVARSVLAPVEEAAIAAERIRTGDLSARVAVTSDDEFGTWAEAFNRMAATLQATIARLEAAEDRNRRFVADVAHELRTPLTALVAEASIVGAHLDDLPPESRRAAELLVADVRRLRTLVEELMELSRFDAGAEQVEVVPVELRRLVGAVVTARLPSARILPGDEVAIESDPRRLERILGNLLDNAREHGGAADVRVTIVPAGEQVVVTVADRGPGVPPDRLDRIFERFSKLEASRSAGSSGLGLAIAAEHAALLGGYLQADAPPDGGLAMSLVLPLTGADGRIAVTESLPDGDGTVIGEDDAEDLAQPAQEPPP
jgi:signal transduction histidine kinase